MSSSSDKEIFSSSVESFDNTVLFKNKKYTYITDNSAQNGSFTSQLQFDLGTLSSQSRHVSLKEAIIHFPIKVNITNTSGNAQTPTYCGNFATCLKNGFHNFINNCQLIVDGKTLQSQTDFENVAANFRILSTWDKNMEDKLGPTLGWARDEFSNTSDQTSNPMASVGLSQIAPSNYGVQMTNVASFAANGGVDKRMEIQNLTATDAGSLGAAIYSNAPASGVSTVDAVGNGVPVPAGADAYCQFVMASVRLADICPAIKDAPLTRNIRGYLYINYNAFKSKLITNASGAFVSLEHNALYGRTNPCLWRLEDNTDSQSFWPSKAAANEWTMTCEISGIASQSRTAAKPTVSYASLVCPYYECNPALDSVLSQRKTYRYLEKQFTEIIIDAESTTTNTISPGIANAKSILLVPFYSAINGKTGLTPWTSSQDTAPVTTGPLATLTDLQVMHGNIPIFNQPQQYTYDFFMQEIASLGLEGGQTNELGSGLFNQKMFEELYRYYYVNLSRGADTEDGASKSVIVQFKNATKLPMRVLAFVFYEKEIVWDTNLTRIEMGRV